MFRLGFLGLLLVHSANCFFDLTDIDDPLSLLWHTKDSIIPQKHTECRVNIHQDLMLSGICKHRTHCLLLGGQSHVASECGFLSACCIVPSTCIKTTKMKISYFTNEVNFESHCMHSVEVMNENVCQMRLDFENFQLSPSTETCDSSNPVKCQRHCEKDYLTVTPDSYHIPYQFCGNNDRQHVYVHLLNLHKEVKLQMHLASRSDNPDAIHDPHWKIKITQLECPGPSHFFTKHRGFKENNDFELLAPQGAVQYYRTPSGRFRSFGLDSSTYGSDEYISGLNYAIAFKRTPFESCIRFRTRYAKLRHPDAQVDENYCTDYLFVPELDISVPQVSYESKFCRRADDNSMRTPITFISHAPGPFYVHFRSADTYEDPADGSPIHAFDIEYDLTTACSKL